MKRWKDDILNYNENFTKKRLDEYSSFFDGKADNLKYGLDEDQRIAVAGQGDINNHQNYLNDMPDDRYPDNVQLILLKDFISLFRVEESIRKKIVKLYNIVDDSFSR